MRKCARIAAAAAIAAASFAMAAPASADVLTFDGNVCSVGGQSNQACSQDDLLDQGYGDTAQVNVQYRYDSTGAASQANSLRFWDDDYSGLTNVAYGTEFGNGASIFFAPTAGYSVTLDSFDLGAWLSPYASSVRIFDGLGVSLFDSGQVVIGTNGQPAHFVPGLTSANGIGISWGPESYNVGIDNVSFTMNRLRGAVPEPATWAMMLVGFGLTGAAMRRSRPQTRVSFAI